MPLKVDTVITNVVDTSIVSLKTNMLEVDNTINSMKVSIYI